MNVIFRSWIMSMERTEEIIRSGIRSKEKTEEMIRSGLGVRIEQKK